MDYDRNEKMKLAKEGIARLHKIDAMLSDLEADHDELDSKASEQKAILDKEERDLEKLENGSIVSFFYSVLGSLGEHINQERREAFAAKLKYDQAVKDLADIKNQIAKMNTDRGAYIHCKKEYDDLYAQKKEELLTGIGATTQKLLELTDQIDGADISLKEIEEAAEKGKEVVSGLNSALRCLDSAEGWGTLDLLGGGLISDLAKHSRIDEAKMEIEYTHRLLRQFKTELVDVNINSDIAINTEGFGKFADFFFDGLIADWCMQSRINESQGSVLRVRDQVSGILEKLEIMRNQVLVKKEKWEKEVDVIIDNA